MTLQDVWQFVLDKPAVASFILAAAVAVICGTWALCWKLLVKPKDDVDTIVKNLIKTVQEKAALSNHLGDAQQKIEDLEENNRQLTEAVQAISNERGKPDAPVGIDEALALLAEGQTGAAEAVLREVKERRKAEGAEALKEAAAAARHIGALAFLHDTEKALVAYREAVDLDPDNADGWNRLGQLLHRRGDLDNAEKALRRVLALGNRVDDQELLSIATGNLGILYYTRGDLDRAEAMYEKSLEIEEALGRKEGMANQYGNLGLLYKTRGDLDRAEEMYKKGLEIDEALGRKEGMAAHYGNLGSLYKTRGDLDHAEEMYEKSLEIDEALGRKEGMASNYGDLGSLYLTRGDLDRAEEMYRKNLEIEKALGRKEGMANNYTAQGLLYSTRGDLDRAEEMYEKSLALNETLGSKEGMASNYGNLGALYETRGDLDRAEEMYEKSLTLFREVGAAPQIKQVEEWLADLRPAD